LDDIELFLEINTEPTSEGAIEGMVVEGANVDTHAASKGHVLQLSEDLRNSLPVSSLQWRPKAHANSNNAQAADGVYRVLPLYLNDTRVHLLAEVRVCVSAAVPAHVWRQRGVAILIQCLDN
jgi:hypothetical protein